MKKQKKIILCEEYHTILKKYPFVLVIHYNNLVNNYVSLENIKRHLVSRVENHNKTSSLRPILHVKVIKNTLIKHATVNTRFQNISPLFCGPTLLVYSNVASVETTQIVSAWLQENTHLQLLGGIFENSLISTLDFKEITQLSPNKDDLLAQTLGLLENSMISMVNTLDEGQRNISYTLTEYKNNQLK